MRQEINDLELEQVAGGRYYVNVNKKLITFSTIKDVFTLKCNPYTAMEAMDSLSGNYTDAAGYDKACVKMLQDNGWI